MLSIVAVVIMIVSGLPDNLRGDPGTSGLNTALVPQGGVAPYDSYVVPASDYPAPESIFGSGTVGWGDPQLVNVLVGQTPTYFLFGTGQSSYLNNFTHQLTTCGALFEESGTYSPQAALSVLNGSSTTTLPISWGTATTIYCDESSTALSADAVTVDPAGGFMMAAVDGCAGTCVFQYNFVTQEWSSASPSSVSGTNPEMSFGGGAAMLVTMGSGDLYATTYYESGVAAVTTTFAISPVSYSPFWIPSEGMGEEGIAYSTSGEVELETSVDGGHTFQHSIIGNYSSPGRPSPLGSVGSTALVDAQGTSGQLAASTAGNTSLILVTTFEQNRVGLESLVSSNDGGTWIGPTELTLPPNLGAIDSPFLAPSSAGYFYAGFDAGGGAGNWSVALAQFTPEGVLVGIPGIVSGNDYEQSAFGGGPLGGSLAVDPFQRPLIVWSNMYPISSEERKLDGLPVEYEDWVTGGYISAAADNNLILAQAVELSSWDFENGTSGVFGTKIWNWNSEVSTNVTTYTSSKTLSHLCSLIGAAGDALYINVTHINLQYGKSSWGCGQTLSYVSKFAREPSGGWPVGLQGENTSSPSRLLPTLGTFTGNTVMAVLGDWLLESLSIPVNYSADPLRAFTPGVGLAALPTLVVATPTADDESANVTVLPQAETPTSGELQVVEGTFPTYTYEWDGPTVTCNNLGGERLPIILIETWAPSSHFTNLTVEGRSEDFQGYSAPVSVYLSNLTPNATARWSANYTATYAGTLENETCEHDYYSSDTSRQTGWPTELDAAMAGGLTTTLREVGLGAIYSQSSGDMYAYWNNSMPAKATATLWKGTSRSTSIYSTSGWNIPDEFGWSGISSGSTYNLSTSTTSYLGGWNTTESPAVSADEYDSSSALTSSLTCEFVAQSHHISIWGVSSNNVTGGNVTVEWFSDPSGGDAWLSYYTVGSFYNLTQSAYQDRAWANGTVEWASELHGVPPGAPIAVHVFSAFTQGCYTDENSTSVALETAPGFPLTEVDNPYDSISQTGGGATIYWTLWQPLPLSNFIGGTILLWNDTAESQLTAQNISSLWLVAYFGDPTYAVNITPTNLNQEYTAEVFLNFTFDYLHTSAVSFPYSFVYQKDTSGDGLTDAEKVRGWYVPVASAPGGVAMPNGSTWVKANPNVWATNGLVSDYDEKLYDLDPDTIDTAGSHMLDTWNLTFNMGTNNHTCPADFECWYENSTNPFSGSYIGNGSATNFSATGPTSEGDTYSWASKVLWAKSDLTTLQNLITSEGVGWLRGVTGTDGSISTLTVWGKLSWGADPLVASTLNDGIPDGQRVNPISTVGIDVSQVFSNASGSLSEGTGYAVKMMVFNGTTTGGTQELSNYSSEALIDESNIINYSATLPVSQKYQFVTVEFQVIADNSSTLSPMWLNSTSQSFTRTVDLVGPYSNTFSYSGAKTYWGQVSGKVQSLWTGYKVPTWLWLPDDNSTVNGLPVGLERYTGEQSFDLVVINASSAIESQPIPLPWGGDAGPRINLSAGLDDILIPREQFMASAFGQAILLGAATAYNASNPYPALVGTSGRSVISHFDGANWMVDLGAYWQNRAINNGATGNITPSTETGTNDSSYLNVQVTAVTHAASNNTGGVLTTSDLYNSSDTPPALQSVVTLNVTNQTNLDLLVAALYDNTTGGSNAVNGTFESVTFATESLDLLPSVLSGIPNVAVIGDGLYGAPVSVPPPPSSSEWGSFWNAVTSVVENPLGAIVSLATVVWSATVAAMTYLNHLVHEAAAIGGTFLARLASALVAVGKLLLQAFDLILKWITELIQALLRPVTNAVVGAVMGYIATLWSDIGPLWAEANASEALNAGQAAHLISDMFGSFITIALVIGAIATVALMVVEDFSLGASFLSNLVLGLIISSTIASLAYLSGNLIPSAGILTTGLLSCAWWAYNATGGGIHMMIAGSVVEFLNLFLGVFGAGLTTLQLTTGDWNAGIQALRALGSMWKDSASEGLALALFQTVSLALDIASIVVAAIGIGEELVGEKDEMASVLGIALGVAGLAASAVIMSSDTAMDEVTSEYKDGLWLGVELGVIGVGAGLVSAAL